MLPRLKSMIAWTIYITFAGAAVLLFLPRVFARWIALATAIAGFGTGLATFFCRICASTANGIWRSWK